MAPPESSTARASSVPTDEGDPDESAITYGAGYYQDYWNAPPYERSPHWLTHFAGVADRIVSDLSPTTALDAGCALGLLVEALVERGVDAYGIDVSQYAIDQADDRVRDRVRAASLTEPIEGRYDLITCIETLEHIPEDQAGTATDNLCGATDRILFSSSPADFAEATHVNLKAPEEWSVEFARRGFYRDLDFDASFVASWAVCYVRGERTPIDLVRAYDRAVARLAQEVNEVRQRIVELHEQVAGEGTGSLRADNLRLENELLSLRDKTIGNEAQLGVALGKMRAAEAELVAYRDAIERLDEIQRSRTYRLFEPYHRVREAVRRRLES